MAAPMEVSLPQTMLQKLLDLLKLESFRPHQEIAVQSIIHVIHQIRCQVNNDYHNQHESTALIGLFHATYSMLLSVESYRNYWKPTQRGVQGYLSSLQRRVPYFIQMCDIASNTAMCYESMRLVVLYLDS